MRKRIYTGIIVSFCVLIFSGCGTKEVKHNSQAEPIKEVVATIGEESAPTIQPYLDVMNAKWGSQTILYKEDMMGNASPTKPMEVIPKERFMELSMKDEVKDFTSSLYEVTEKEIKAEAIQTLQNSTAVSIPEGDAKVYSLEISAEKGKQYFLLFTSSKQPVASIKPSTTKINVGEEIRFLVKNEGLTTLMYGSDFSIFQEQNGEWVDVSPYDAFTAIVYMMPPGKDFVEVTTLQEPSLKAGKYKLVKKFGVENAPEKDFTLEAEFIIN
ncbi:immunoglobulin-like domain-containing protein [Mangrovibacillus cuniculi]|uniref:Bacterial Ig-like domain-containing protein n=1 Tax=Mangrovibacillus cuniculi TaxID=2593652 RepID=A0A7S8HGD1_9BACI|nr:immunoglobulin-like domain-containing protein [Mangrovibacillus cuniculi]QPC47677.1 hypothetical protein G8O30_12285 [Mangrovibacillus cuniculi]